MISPEEMRAHALDCDKRAQKVRDPTLQRRYELLAGQWRDLASQAAEREAMFASSLQDQT